MQDSKKLHLKINRLVDSLFVGKYKTAFKWKWLEFSDYRFYTDGDDSKYIDFLISAKEWKLLIKRFQEERELSVFFFLDMSESMNFWEETTKCDTLKEIFYILSLSAIKSNDKIGALIFNDSWYEFVKIWKWMKTIHTILEIIESKKIKPIEKFNVNSMIIFFNNLPVKNNLVFLLTDKTNEILDGNLKILSVKHDFVYINIFDSIENNLIDDSSILRFKNNWTTFFINLRNTTKVLKYKELRLFQINEWKKKLHTYKISYLCIDNTTNILVSLLKFFKSR